MDSLERPFAMSPRQSTETAPACSGSVTDLNNYPLRVGSIFIIFAASLIGAMAPILLSRSTRMHVPKMTFFVFKYVGTGVIIGTAWMHLLADGATALGDPCLVPVLGTYQWAFAIGLMTVMVMFLVEMLAARFGEDSLDDHGHSHGHGHGYGHSHSNGLGATHGHKLDKIEHTVDPPVDVEEAGAVTTLAPPCPHETSRELNGDPSVVCFPGPDSTRIPGLPDDVSYPPGGQDHFGHGRQHSEGDAHPSLGGQLTAILILEFGVVFHSVFIGLALATSNELVVLLVVLVFHQCFEGLGLGSRLAVHSWPARRRWLPYGLALLYAISTPISIAIGLVAHSNNAQTQLLVGGIFDSISGGVLMYTGLVELLAHEFMFSSEMRKAPLNIQLFAYGCVAAGAAIMAVLAKWA